MKTTAQRMRDHTGPAVLSVGLRPFFLGAAIWSAVSVLIWLPLLAGDVALPTHFGPVNWHVHELLYGYVPAVIAGFLLTAIPNWTGRLPVTGMPLFYLFALWLAGRLAVLFSAWVGPLSAAVIDVGFLASFIFIVGREILASGKRNNLNVLAVVGAICVGNAMFHAQVYLDDGSSTLELYGTRIGLGAILLLIMLIGGRVVPSFTRNYLVQNAPDGRLPIPFNRFDMVCVGMAAVTFLAWIILPEHAVSGSLALLAGALHFVRLGRWAGDRSTGAPMVFVLHVAYMFVPVGFILLAGSILVPDMIAQSGAVHSWTAGAIGMMTMAIMTRASLGHTGRTVTATRPVQLIYYGLFLAAVARILVAFDIYRDSLLTISAFFWVASFAIFVVVYWPILTRPRI